MVYGYACFFFIVFVQVNIKFSNNLKSKILHKITYDEPILLHTLQSCLIRALLYVHYPTIVALY